MPNTVNDPHKHLSALEEKKLALARVIKIASSLESMRLGLTAVFHLGQPKDELPEIVLTFFTSLGKKVKNLSDLEIQTRLTNLQSKIKAKLGKVIEITAELDELSNLNNQRIDEINHLVEDYKRHAQTAVALSILLQRRGVATTPIGLSLTKKTMLTELKRIKTQEHQQREEAIQKTLAIRKDIGIIKANPHTSDSVRQMLDMIAENLKQNILHLKAGHSITDLPFEVEDIEFNDLLSKAPSVSEPDPKPETDTPKVHLKPATTQDNATSADNAPPPPQQASGIGRVWQQFRMWLNTPWNVSWQDLKKKPPKK